jgi:hypothetical protein
MHSREAQSEGVLAANEKQLELKRIRRELRARDEERWKATQAETLLDLASMSEGDCGRFRERFRYVPQPDDSTLLTYRDNLRELWRNPSDENCARYLNAWVLETHRGKAMSWVVASGSVGYMVIPNDCILPLSLALAVSELGPKMGVCANPQCPQPFFLKGRKGQRFCDRPTCAAYGQREHKRNWWREHGEEMRRKAKTRRHTKKKRRHDQ